MNFMETDGELGSDMTLGHMRAATMFRVSAQITKIIQPNQLRVLTELHRRLGLDDQRGIHDSAKWILRPPTGRALS